MTEFAADIGQKFPSRSATRDEVKVKGTFTIGSAGAVDASAVDDPAVTLARSATGTYDLTYPKCLAAHIDVSLLSAAGTVRGWFLTAKDAKAGTATFKTHDAATPTVADPASGNSIEVRVYCETRAD
jgi:hypothetical protein